MPKLELERSININATPERVFDVISDLGKWRPWNPWLVAEPEATVDVTRGGKAYSWKGKRTGSGRMSILHEKKPSELGISLQFLTPFKSRSKVGFVVEENGDGAHVTWSMDGSLPFFLFFLKNTMTTMLGMDYSRGLLMLKDYIETGEVPSKLEWKGEATYPGCTYVGIQNQCAIGDVGKVMSEDFIKLSAWAKETSTQLSDRAFSVYHKWDLDQGTCIYTSGFPVDEVPASFPAGFETGTIPPIRVYQIAHKGPYRHLGNAWSAGMQMAQKKEFRQSKDHPPFEIYVDMPGSVSENEQEVLVCFPIK